MYESRNSQASLQRSHKSVRSGDCLGALLGPQNLQEMCGNQLRKFMSKISVLRVLNVIAVTMILFRNKKHVCL